jgi:hypothetical protein
MNCHECILCSGLENQQYCIENISYPKEEYHQKKKDILIQNNKFNQYYTSLGSTGENWASVDVTGNFVWKSELVENGLMCYQIRD